MQGLKAINLLLLAALVGVELFLGIVVAKAIFYAPLNHAVWNDPAFMMFDRGALMTGIFVAFGWVALVISVLNLGFELINLRQDAPRKFKISKLLLAVINLVLAGLFCLYYTREIAISVDAILQGLESVELFASAEFRDFHAQSERLVKVLVIFQVLLFFLNFKKQSKI